MVKAVESYFTHTEQEAYYSDTTGELVGYRIYPDEGYMLHDKERDVYITDPATGEVLEDSKGFTSGVVTVGSGYDFEVNPREIYAVMAEQESEV